jgi:hypothetical protein
MDKLEWERSEEGQRGGREGTLFFLLYQSQANNCEEEMVNGNSTFTPNGCGLWWANINKSCGQHRGICGGERIPKRGWMIRERIKPPRKMRKDQQQRMRNF